MDVASSKLRRRAARRAELFARELVVPALGQSFVMLSPRRLARNPVMLTCAVGAALVTLAAGHDLATGAGGVRYQLLVALILWATVLFANFSEALAEARGKAQADTLRATRQATPARRLSGE